MVRSSRDEGGTFPGTGSVFVFFADLESAVFHLLEDIGHVLDAFPYVIADVDGSLLLEGDGDAVAGSRVEFDDLFVLEFIFGLQDEARVVNAVFEVVDDDALYVDAQREKHIADEVVSLGALLWGASHEHGDSSANALVDIDYEGFFFVSDEDSAASAGWKDGADFYFGNVAAHGFNVRIAERVP